MADPDIEVHATKGKKTYMFVRSFSEFANEHGAVVGGRTKQKNWRNWPKLEFFFEKFWTKCLLGFGKSETFWNFRQNSLRPWPARQGTGLFRTCDFWARNHFVLGPCSGPRSVIEPCILPLASCCAIIMLPLATQYNTNCHINVSEGQKWQVGSKEAIQQQLAFARAFSLQASCCLLISFLQHHGILSFIFTSISLYLTAPHVQVELI